MKERMSPKLTDRVDQRWGELLLCGWSNKGAGTNIGGESARGLLARSAPLSRLSQQFLDECPIVGDNGCFLTGFVGNVF